MSNLDLKDKVMFDVSKALKHELNMKGNFFVKHYRQDLLIATYKVPNGIVNEGRQLILNVMFASTTPIALSNWRVGLYNSGAVLNNNDTMASHSGWTEYTNYSQTTRPAWGQSATSTTSITNSSPVTFDITGSGTIGGIFITSNDVKGGTSGVLWSTAPFPSGNVTVANGDQLKVTYTLSTS